MQNGLIFDIQGFSLHDGPGCRTLVFLNGCSLRCSWCANPEGQANHTRLMFRSGRCRKSGACLSACPYQAIQFQNEIFVINRLICDECDQKPCAIVCPSQALQVSGREISLDEIKRILLRDQSFWGGRGGVTFTGGEPFVQSSFFLPLLQFCREAYMHVAVETCAQVETEKILDALDWIDWLFIDLKHMDTERHRRETGAGNELILFNIATVARSGWGGRLVVRIPIVPGFNDDDDNIHKTASFLAETGVNEVNLLPFHRLGASKYEQLGLEYKFASTEPPEEKKMHSIKSIFTDAGLQCYLGSETPF